MALRSAWFRLRRFGNQRLRPNGARFLVDEAGSSSATFRHPIKWDQEEFYDPGKLDLELRRVFDICHGCRRCYSLCNSFPRLFDLIDNSPSGELDTVPSSEFKPVVDDCTLCDMCYLTKCPYTPPHEFNLDFPHLILRYRAVESKEANLLGVKNHFPQVGKDGLGEAAGGMWMASHGEGTKHGSTAEGVSKQLDLKAPDFFSGLMTNTDLIASIAGKMPTLTNWALSSSNAFSRGLIDAVASIHRDADLPPYVPESEWLTNQQVPSPDPNGPAKGRRVLLYATCIGNFSYTGIGQAALHVLARQGVEVRVVHPGCCGMPQLEQGQLANVADKAAATAAELLPSVEEGWEIVSLTPSCSLMLKSEWPLLLPNNNDVSKLAAATTDISEYVANLAKAVGLAEGLGPVAGIDKVQLHMACHTRAQNVGNKAAEFLRKVPGIKVAPVEKCSGHGGSWGCRTTNFPVAKKVGEVATRQIHRKPPAKKQPAGADDCTSCLSSECPMAGVHLTQIKSSPHVKAGPVHPIQLLAASYGDVQLPANPYGH